MDGQVHDSRLTSHDSRLTTHDSRLSSRKVLKADLTNLNGYNFNYLDRS